MGAKSYILWLASTSKKIVGIHAHWMISKTAAFCAHFHNDGHLKRVLRTSAIVRNLSLRGISSGIRHETTVLWSSPLCEWHNKICPLIFQLSLFDIYKYIYAEELVRLFAMRSNYYIILSYVYIKLMVLFDKKWAVICQYLWRYIGEI